MNGDDIVGLMKSMYEEGATDGRCRIEYGENAIEALCRTRLDEVKNVVHKKYNINPHTRADVGWENIVRKSMPETDIVK